MDAQDAKNIELVEEKSVLEDIEMLAWPRNLAVVPADVLDLV
ncbi:hypothetical protein [Streptomyces sp. NRRL F-2747]|nr:hypothetical protein [Streptomyces sp. NRRL F-2747]